MNFPQKMNGLAVIWKVILKLVVFHRFSYIKTHYYINPNYRTSDSRINQLGSTATAFLVLQ